jgi:hypothetical protein
MIRTSVLAFVQERRVLAVVLCKAGRDLTNKMAGKVWGGLVHVVECEQYDLVRIAGTSAPILL